MKSEFDQIKIRHNTRSIKWDYIEEQGRLRPLVDRRSPMDPAALLPLSLSDMDFAAPPAVQEALMARVGHGIFGYTAVDDDYYRAIVNWLARRHAWAVEADWILTTSGVMQAINLAVQTLTEPGDQIIVQPPVFDPIVRAVSNNGRVVSPNRLQYDSGRYSIDFADLEARAAAPGCRMLILCHPHNPVGRIWSPDELARIAAICHRHDLIVISDEIHGDLNYSWATFSPFGAAVPHIDSRLVVCTGPSKAFNLPGLRTALAIVPDARLRRRLLIGLRNLNEDFGVNALGTLALQTAYERGEAWLDDLLIYLEDNYLYLRDFMSAELTYLKLVPAEGLYLAWIDCRSLGLNEAGLKKVFFEDAGVLLEWGSHFGPQGAGFVRLNLACPRPILELALERIERAFLAWR